MNPEYKPGMVVLFGSGETSPSGQKLFDIILRQLPVSPRIALLETPAGFELNSAQVIGRVVNFIQHHLKNYSPQQVVIPARQRGTAFSPDDAEIAAPILEADLIFMGPGSPTYAVRQLKESITWQYILASHRLGAHLAFSSAATLAISEYVLPVYEIFKVGEELHWKNGLNLFGLFGSSLVFIPHWNNHEGGVELDTSRCFIGMTRFEKLMDILPAEITVIGIDENTGLVIDPVSGVCQVIGSGGVTLIHTGKVHQDAIPPEDLQKEGLIKVVEQRQGHVHHFQSSQVFQFSRIGSIKQLEITAGIEEQLWNLALEKRQQRGIQGLETQPSTMIAQLVQQREQARVKKDWSKADELRNQIELLGWLVADTPDGPVVRKKES